MNLEEELNRIFENTRSHASYFVSGEKERRERTVNEVLNSGEALDSVIELAQLIGDHNEIKSVFPRGREYEKKDPPDLEIVMKNGSNIGIEVTELVDEDKIRSSEKDDRFDPEIDKLRFLDLFRKRILQKDKRWKETFTKKVLLMLCDEPYLNKSICSDYLEDVNIEIMNFDLSLILFSPEPNEDECKYLILNK